MKSLARFVIRPASPDGRGDLVLGAMLKEQDTSLLAPNVIYEIRDIMGTLMIVPVGPAAIGDVARPSQGDVCWHNDVSHILTMGRGSHLLTRGEAEAHLRKRQAMQD